MYATLELAAKHRLRPIAEAHRLDVVNQVLERVRENKPRFRTVLTMDP